MQPGCLEKKTRELQTLEITVGNFQFPELGFGYFQRIYFQGLKGVYSQGFFPVIRGGTCTPYRVVFV